MTISDKIRVYELSRDLKLENKDILDAAQKLSISVKSHSSSISLEDAKKIKNLINNKNTGKKILSVSKSTFKAKTEKPANNDNKNNKTLSSNLHPENLSKEVSRILSSKGKFIIAFSNRAFWHKAPNIWTSSTEEERVRYVRKVLISNGFHEPKIIKKFNQPSLNFFNLINKDPFYCLIATKE